MDEGVDLDVAARGAAWACFLNMGQVCTSVERFYVVGKVFDEFVDRFVAYHEDAAHRRSRSVPTWTSGP